MNPLRWTMISCALSLAAAACHRAPAPLPDLGLSLPEPETSQDELERFLAAAALPESRLSGSSGGDGARLDEPSLRRLALERHPAVVSADLALRQAEAAVARAARWPNPSLEGKILFDKDGNPAGEAALKFALPLGGRLGAGREQASLALGLARLELDAARREALAAADEAMARLALAEAKLALFRAVSERSAQFADLARSRREAALADPVDVALILADAARDRQRKVRAAAAVRKAELGLLRLCGLPADGSATIALAPLQRRRLADDRQSLHQAAEAFSDRVGRARLAFRLADGLLALRLAERWPDLKLGPALAGDAGGLALGLALGLELPLIHQRDAEVVEARLARNRAAEALRQEVRDLRSRLDTRLVEVETLDAELDGLLLEAAGELDKAATLAEVRFNSGQLDVLRLLGVHRALASLRLETLELLHAQSSALIGLEAEVGRPLRLESVEVAP